MNILKWTTLSIMLIGALNWGLVGLFGFDLVSYIFGEMSIVSRIIYVIVSLCALSYFVIAMLDNQDRNCFN